MNQNAKIIITALIVILLGIAGYAYLTTPEKTTVGEKIGNAVNALPDGVGKAAEQLHDRTPGEKLGDAIQDAGEKIKDNTRADH